MQENSKQSKTYRVMDGGEWAWLLVFTYLRAIYLQNCQPGNDRRGVLAVVAAVVLGAIPIVNIGVAVWGLVAMHDVYGCKTALTAFGVWVGISVLFFAILIALG